jgi:pimeloyl-ACP methyl ester carboxylesterase
MSLIGVAVKPSARRSKRGRGAVTKRTRNHLDDLRGVSRLAIEATRSITDLVEAMNLTIGGGPAILGRPLLTPTRAITGLVYGSIRGVTRLVGAGIDRALAQLAPLVPEDAPGPEREAVLAVLNGVLGDYLSATGNPLAIRMQLRQGGRPLELERRALKALLPQAGGKLLLLLHGSCLNDRQWLRLGHDHGAALARDLGYTPVYLLYNSGLHISTNGRAFAALLEELVAAWPVPIDELVILGHSMGGLVARSACHYGEAAGHHWRRKLDKLVCLGSPHHGAMLERGGSWLELLLGVSRYSAPLARLGKIRSAGVTDMRFGLVLDEHWEGRERFAQPWDPRSQLKLPDGVECYAIAGTTAPGPQGKLPGDGLVSVDSALGRHRKPELTLAFPETHQWIGFEMGHVDLLHRAEVYETLRGWLR